MSSSKVGIQLIVFGDKERKDLDGVLKDCKKAGYDYIETGFLFDTYSVRQLQKTCEKYKLEYAGVHDGFDNFRKRGKLI